jgi:hypothetical protein
MFLDRHKDVSAVPSAWDDLVRNCSEGMEIIHRLFLQGNWSLGTPYSNFVTLFGHIEMPSAIDRDDFESVRMLFPKEEWPAKYGVPYPNFIVLVEWTNNKL